MSYRARRGWKAPKATPACEESAQDGQDSYKDKIKAFDTLMLALRKNSLDWKEVKSHLSAIYPECSELIELDFCRAFGMDFELKSSGEVYLNTRARSFGEQKFCVVDLETTAGSPSEGQILEIGAVMWQHGQVLAEFSELIYAPEVPEVITELTGITAEMVCSARSIERVLGDFRAFLGDAVFVAHGAHFDYNFVAKSSLEILGAPLLNRRLDTLKLARSCIDAPKHGLQTLKELLGVDNQQHRALNDARAACAVLDFCLTHLNSRNKVIEDLLLSYS